MFHATRPLVRWSRVVIWRAKVKGWACRTELVKPKPRCSVTAAIGGISSIGSFTGVWAALLTAAADGYRPLSLTVRLGADEWDRELTFRLAPDPESLVEVELLLRDSRGDPVREITIMRVFATRAASTHPRCALRTPQRALSSSDVWWASVEMT